MKILDKCNFFGCRQMETASKGNLLGLFSKTSTKKRLREVSAETDSDSRPPTAEETRSHEKSTKIEISEADTGSSGASVIILDETNEMQKDISESSSKVEKKTETPKKKTKSTLLEHFR